MVTKQEGISSLRNVPMFEVLSQEELSKVFDLARVVHYDADTAIVTEGETGFGFHFILDGSARVERNGRPVATLGPGKFFGEMSFIDDQPRSASVVAESDLQSLVLGGWEFKPLVKTHPELAWKLLVHLAARLREEQSAADAAIC